MAKREYREGAHTVYDLKYHLVWVTKYRYKVLEGDVAVRVRDLIRQVCMTREIKIIKGHVSRAVTCTCWCRARRSCRCRRWRSTSRGGAATACSGSSRRCASGTGASTCGRAGILLRLVGRGDGRDDQGVHRAAGRPAGRRVHGDRREALAGFEPHADGLQPEPVNFQLLPKPTDLSRWWFSCQRTTLGSRSPGPRAWEGVGHGSGMGIVRMGLVGVKRNFMFFRFVCGSGRDVGRGA